MKPLPKYRSELHDLLVDSLDVEMIEGDRVDTVALAKALGYSRYHIYRHLTENRLSSKLARRLVALSLKSKDPLKKGILTPEIMTKYVLSL